MALLAVRSARSPLFAALFALGAAGASAATCPDLTGHYRVDGFGPALGDAVKALVAEMAGFIGSEVRLASRGSSLEVYVKSGNLGTMGSAPRVLEQGAHFRCDVSTLTLTPSVLSYRKTDSAYLEGRSTVRLSRNPGGGLTIVASFSGRERSVLYAYDSARLSLPKLGTGQTISESIRWPDLSERAPSPSAMPARGTMPSPAAAPAADADDPPDVRAVRQRLDTRVLGGVVLGPMRPEGDGVRVTLTAQRSEHVIALEDRLRFAGIPYEVQREPFWSNNTYQLQLLLWPEGRHAGAPWRPTRMRIEHEVRRVVGPFAEVEKVDSIPDGYRATLRMSGQMSLDQVVSRLRTSSGVIADATGEGGQGAGDTARLQLRLR